MSTRAQVLYMRKNDNGNWDAIYSWYHHCDGYPEYMWSEVAGVINYANQCFNESNIDFVETIKERFEYYDGYEYEQEDAVDFIPLHGDLEFQYYILDCSDHLELFYNEDGITNDLNVSIKSMKKYS